MAATLPYMYFRNHIVPAEDAKISIASNSLQYGTTCFAGIRGYVRQGKIRLFRLEDHYIRLLNGCKIMGFNFHLAFEEFQKVLIDLIQKNHPTSDFYIRPFVFSQDQRIGPKPIGLTYELAIFLVPLGNYFDLSKGMRLMISSWRKFSDTALPTKAKAGGCYVNSFLATGEALRCGYDEALVMDDSGYIVEASVANILVVHRDRLIMPQVGTALLEGITMRTVIELLQEDGLKIHFGPVDRSMLYTCQELLLMGTAAQISFADSVDGRKIGKSHQDAVQPGPVCLQLREKYEMILNKKHPKADQWILEIG